MSSAIIKQSVPEITYTVGDATLKNICHQFNERVKEIMSGANKNYTPLNLGLPTECLLQAGLPNLQMEVSVRTLTTKSSQSNHPFRLSDIIHLPEYICNPIAVFRSATTTDDIKVILTEMEAEGINIVVVVHPNQVFKGISVNSIRSIYPKDNIRPILEWICEHDLMEYHNKQKILNWLGKHQYNPGDVAKLIKDTANIISNMV